MNLKKVHKKGASSAGCTLFIDELVKSQSLDGTVKSSPPQADKARK
ncbi:MAG: hypothetical protein Q8O04_10795 [Deltaproteobacteria bacterium]|nr:hypothetical protein [Deltaproteobacteria bacterium]